MATRMSPPRRPKPPHRIPPRVMANRASTARMNAMAKAYGFKSMATPKRKKPRPDRK